MPMVPRRITTATDQPFTIGYYLNYILNLIVAAHLTQEDTQAPNKRDV